MSFERIAGLFVTDDAAYDTYRAEMKPIMARYGGAFRFDFRVSETLTSSAPHEINRVFLMRFPDEASCDAFFADPEYLAVRARLFDASVRAVSVIARYTRTD